MRVITLKPQPLTPESFAPFGNILNLDRSEIVCTEGVLTARITHAPLRDLSEERPHFLNRHMEETQIFVPLGGKDGLFFVGPPSETPDSFDPANVALFHFPGDHAIRMHVGTWHVAPFAVTEPTRLHQYPGRPGTPLHRRLRLQGARWPGISVRLELGGA